MDERVNEMQVLVDMPLNTHVHGIQEALSTGIGWFAITNTLSNPSTARAHSHTIL